MDSKMKNGKQPRTLKMVPNGVKVEKDTGVSSIKHNNTRATMILYFCIMTVLMCCCLGRCLVVPLSQASRFELNSRKHIGKLDKSAFI
jgi:hypothetical protein